VYPTVYINNRHVQSLRKPRSVLHCAGNGSHPHTKKENHLSHTISGVLLLRSFFLWSSSPTKFGFLAEGVYLVPLPMFPWELRHCGTFKVFRTYPKDLALFPGVSFSSSFLGLLALASILQASQPGRAWTFLKNNCPCDSLRLTLYFYGADDGSRTRDLLLHMAGANVVFHLIKA